MRSNKTFVMNCLAAAASLHLAPAIAQPRPDPSDPAAQVPAAQYVSPFAGYRPIGDDPVGNWRTANDEVRRIGGWREYAREAQAPEGAPAAPAAARSEPAPSASGHGPHASPAQRGAKP